MRAHQIHVDPGPRHYYESHDRDTPLCTADPLITFHLSGSVSAIYARQASLTLLATDERTIDRFLTYAYSCAYGLCERMQAVCSWTRIIDPANFFPTRIQNEPSDQGDPALLHVHLVNFHELDSFIAAGEERRKRCIERSIFEIRGEITFNGYCKGVLMN